ncbi:MAG: class I SAM-dependent methyltransferase [Bacteroidota bacterium]|nr:class I SAM-dependent methyltransferase [Bacteroidota bacterium]
MSDLFVNIQLNFQTLDRYIIRKAIFRALNNKIYLMQGALLDVGCGKMPYRNYILENSKVTNYTGIDIEAALIYDEGVTPDYYWDGIQIPFNDNSYDCVIATEVLEHCPVPETVLKEIFRVLKPGGVFFYTVPFLWNLHEVPHDEYRYTPFSLERHLKTIGFNLIQLNATGGWHAAMAQMLGLWVKRSGISQKKQKVLAKLIKPIMIKLLKMDDSDKVTFKEGQMITGLSGVAYK